MMKIFGKAPLALLLLLTGFGFSGASMGHGDEPHGSHDAAFGGLVMMYIDLHFEVVLPEAGGIEIYYSDAGRSPLPAAVVSNVQVDILRKGTEIETLVMSASDAGDFWAGDGMTVTNPETIVRVAFVFQDEPVVFELPARLFPAFMENMEEMEDETTAMPAHHA